MIHPMFELLPIHSLHLSFSATSVEFLPPPPPPSLPGEAQDCKSAANILIVIVIDFRSSFSDMLSPTQFTLFDKARLALRASIG